MYPDGGMADTTDLKSVDRKVVRVRAPLRVPKNIKPPNAAFIFLYRGAVGGLGCLALLAL